jgi:hypothetical protein
MVRLTWSKDNDRNSLYAVYSGNRKFRSINATTGGGTCTSFVYRSCASIRSGSVSRREASLSRAVAELYLDEQRLGYRWRDGDQRRSWSRMPTRKLVEVPKDGDQSRWRKATIPRGGSRHKYVKAGADNAVEDRGKAGEDSSQDL